MTLKLPTEYDVLVVGSGHAGIEAALAAARMGCRTLMLTQNLDTIGQMSCNPAIGGLGKAHIVRDIDAMGVAIGLNADATVIQFRILHRSKGTSVRAPRVQCDKKAYQFRMKALLESADNLDIKQATVSQVTVDDRRAVGVETDLGLRIAANAVIITSGTFLRGLLHVGESRKPGGRMGDASSNLSENLRQLGFQVGRFKTGTPCRLNARSIDFSRCAIQIGDEPPPTFTFDPEEVASGQGREIFTLNSIRAGKFHVEQLPCWITATTTVTHDIVRANLHRSPLYAGRIKGTGPRYCPSIEDKVVKFSTRDSHQIFLEPEGCHTSEYYVNGTSGYEEAAAQGLIAGANAALKVQALPPFILDRREAYIGVLIDDLVTKGTEEPYRMFTSRAEDRLFLRHDNADQRLTGRAFTIQLISKSRDARFQEKMRLLELARSTAVETKFRGIPIAQLFKRPNFRMQGLPGEIFSGVPTAIWELVATDFKYEGYATRQREQNRQLERRSDQIIPDGLDYNNINGLRSETRQKLANLRPSSIRRAARISGITPADVAIISIWLSKNDIPLSHSQ